MKPKPPVAAEPAATALQPAVNHDRLLSIAGALEIPTARIEELVKSGSTAWRYDTYPAGVFEGVAGIGRLMTIRRGPSTDLGTLLGQEIVVKHVLIHPASAPDEDGELHDYPRVLLIAPDGSVVSCGALSVLTALNEISVGLQRPLPFEPALVFRVHQRPTTPPRRIYWLEPVRDYVP